MDASIIQLRYKMRDVLKALERREKVNILYHGRVKGVLLPVKRKRNESRLCIEKHPFFRMSVSANKESVESVMNRIRKTRYHDFRH